MKFEIVSKLVKGEEIPVNKKGCEEVEISSIDEINAFSFNKEIRLIGIGKELYKLSLKSYKKLRKFLQRTNTKYIKTV